jgi:hypothetical protein
MTDASFDPTHAVRFDLAHGAVHAGAHGERLVMVPSAALEQWVALAPQESSEGLGRAMGTAIGRRAAARIESLVSASPELFITQLAGEAAMAGLGTLSVERWGRALVVLVDDCPLPTSLLAAFVAGAIEASTGRGVSTLLLDRDGGSARVLVTGEPGTRRVRDWMAEGETWGAALARLQRRSA